jgi:hypothetical protein
VASELLDRHSLGGVIDLARLVVHGYAVVDAYIQARTKR